MPGNRYCCVGNCHRNSRNKEVRFFRIPTVVTHRGLENTRLTSARRLEWLKRLNLLDTNVTDAFRVCDAHFVLGKYNHEVMVIYLQINWFVVCVYTLWA